MKITSLAAALVGSSLLAGAAHAQSVAALVGDDTIAIVDVAAKKVDRSMKVSGLSGALVGIDVRPADGMLYGLVADGTVVTIDPASGKATMKSKLDAMLAPGTMATVDFNPVADRLRIIGSDGMNLRANVDDGKVTKDGQLKFAEADMHKGKMPKVVAGAYTNSMKGAKETTLYDIEASGVLVKQAPPNDGVLNSVGMLGMEAGAIAFDIVSGDAMSEGWLMSGKTLYKVDLTTGKASQVAMVSGVERQCARHRGDAEGHVGWGRRRAGLRCAACSGAAAPHGVEALVEEIGEVRDADEPVGGRERAGLLPLAGEAHCSAPFLGLHVAAADIDQGDQVGALVVVEAGDHVAKLLLGGIVRIGGEGVDAAVVDRVRARGRIGDALFDVDGPGPENEFANLVERDVHVSPLSSEKSLTGETRKRGFGSARRSMLGLGRRSLAFGTGCA